MEHPRGCDLRSELLSPPTAIAAAAFVGASGGKSFVATRATLLVKTVRVNVCPSVCPSSYRISVSSLYRNSTFVTPSEFWLRILVEEKTHAKAR